MISISHLQMILTIGKLSHDFECPVREIDLPAAARRVTASVRDWITPPPPPSPPVLGVFGARDRIPHWGRVSGDRDCGRRVGLTGQSLTLSYESRGVNSNSYL